MAGSIQSTIILAKVESTAGTDAAPTAAADGVALRISNLRCKVSQKMATRDTLAGFFGAADQLPYTRRGEISFSVDLAGSGAAGTAPAWGDLLLGCGASETVTASTRVDYLPSSASLKTLTIWAVWNGKLYKFAFCMGSWKLGNFKVGQVPTLDFTFKGLVSSVAAGSLTAPTLTPWIRPVAMGPLNTTALQLGCTYSAGALSGGTAYALQELTLDDGADVQDQELAVNETIGIFGREPKATMIVDLGATAAATKISDMAAGTTTSIGVTHGTAAGNKIIVYAPLGVITDVDDNVNGNVMLNSMALTLRDSASPGDAWRIVAL